MYTSQRELSTSKLFSDSVQYKVPRYQRRYVWDKTNWCTLSEDILALLGLELEGNMKSGFTFIPLEQHKDTSTERDKKHFTGIIATRQVGYGEPEIFEVIDGQQRLTTFQIILCVIRDIFESKNCHEQAKEPQQLIVNDSNVVNRTGEETTYKFCPTEFDIKEFEKIANREYGETISLEFDEESNRLPDEHMIAINNKFANSDSHNILDAYNYFYTLTMAYIHKDKGWKHELANLLVTVKTQLKVLLTTLDESDHSEKIFESLNATGRKLAEFDYLRNNLFLRARQLVDDKESDKSYVEKFYNDYWHFENTHSYWDAEKLESFLQVFLMAKLGPHRFQSSEEDGKDRKAFEVYQQLYCKEVKGEAIIGNFDEYDDKYDTEYNQIKYEFQELAHYSNTYRCADPDPKARDPEAESDRLWHRIRRRMEFYNDLKMKNFLPFILHLRWEAKKSINELEMIFQILESYIIRRLVNEGNIVIDEDKDACEAIDDVFSDLIKGEEFDIEKFAKILPGWPSNNDIFRSRGNSDAALRRITNSTDSEKHSPKTRERAWSLISYIFYRIEENLAKENKLSFEDFPSSYKPTRIGAEHELGQMSHWLSIGNLTFREEDKEIDSTMVDKSSFHKTKEILSTPPNSSLELNKKICKEENWGTSQYNKYFELLEKQFCLIWPHKELLIKEIEARTFKPDENLIKTYIGEIKFWGGSVVIVKCSDFEKPIRAKYDDFKDKDDKPIQIGQKVKFEISPTQREGKFLKGINVVRIEE